MYDCADLDERSGKKHPLTDEDKEEIAEFDKAFRW